MEALIAAGRVSVAGRKASLGDRASVDDRIEIDGRAVTLRPQTAPLRVLLYHKPVGELVTRHDPGGRATVFDRLPSPRQGRWIAIGRLDLNTSGLLLLTDSGTLANRMMHPRYEVEREYLVRVLGTLSASACRRLRQGVVLEDGVAAFARLEPLRDGAREAANRWYRVVLREGRTREVRRMFEAVGAKVSRLMRVRFGSVRLPRALLAGRWIELDADQCARLLSKPAEETVRTVVAEENSC